MLLPSWGLRVTTVENTHDALERLRQATNQGRALVVFGWCWPTSLSIRATALALARNLERKNQYGEARLVYPARRRRSPSGTCRCRRT
ncbi:hypothetical protein [Thermomonas sp.]|uniref:hypothetical protein n=1 Tax=Thermomonas sp. TaxID=1971895 RepID=UPI001EB9878B|nr:hypothetical protein [Thermomonas sp.]MBK6415370.1 hypothetical protein [Thermomonas sp.]